MEIIRQTGYLSSVPLQEKPATLEDLYNRPGNPFSVHKLCDSLKVARGTFYNHIFRKADRSKYREEQTQLMLMVKQVFDDSEQRFGAEKIRIVLAESGIRVGKKRISAIMQELGLCSVRTDAKKQFKRKQQYAKQNLLKRELSADHPNQVWVSDITYFKATSYWVYLCIILDLYSRKIIGWRVSKHMSTHLVTATFKAAYQERGRPQNLTFHSDRGSQYVSKTLIELFQQHGVKQSFSATVRPLDNAVAETFFSSFKREEAYRKTTPLNSTFVGAWRRILGSAMRCVPIRHWPTSPRPGSRHSTESRTYEKPVSKLQLPSNLFPWILAFFHKVLKFGGFLQASNTNGYKAKRRRFSIKWFEKRDSFAL